MKDWMHLHGNWQLKKNCHWIDLLLDDIFPNSSSPTCHKVVRSGYCVEEAILYLQLEKQVFGCEICLDMSCKTLE